jgi:hypothetical protein
MGSRLLLRMRKVQLMRWLTSRRELSPWSRHPQLAGQRPWRSAGGGNMKTTRKSGMQIRPLFRIAVPSSCTTSVLPRATTVSDNLVREEGLGEAEEEGILADHMRLLESI